MNATTGYALTPLARMLRTLLFAPVLLAMPAYGESPYPTMNVPGGVRDLTPGQPTYNWTVSNGRLNSVEGVTTGFISVNSGDVNLVGTTVDGTGVTNAIYLDRGSSLSLSGSTVSGASYGIRTNGVSGDPATDFVRTSIANSNISGSTAGIFLTPPQPVGSLRQYSKRHRRFQLWRHGSWRRRQGYPQHHFGREKWLLDSCVKRNH